jgi:hypothetical protein
MNSNSMDYQTRKRLADDRRDAIIGWLFICLMSLALLTLAATVGFITLKAVGICAS